MTSTTITTGMAAESTAITNNDQVNNSHVDNLTNANDRPELDLNCRNFDAKAYIQHTLQGASHSALDGTELLCEVSTAKQETSENMKQLIKDNLAVFINSKDAISAVYNSDAELFTGVALEQIRDTFKETKENGREMLQPLLKLYDNVQKQHATQQLLEKMSSVLSIPGILYKCASVRVATERTHNKHEMRNSTDDEFTNTGSEQVRSRRSGSSRRPTQGLLEEIHYYDNDNKKNNLVGSGGSGSNDSNRSRYVIHDDEEIFYWYGTPLVRFRDAEVQHNEEELYNNYEGAVMALRRALRYIEENYNVETAKLVGENEEYDEQQVQENDQDEDKNENARSGSILQNGNKVGQKNVSKQTKLNRTPRVHFSDKDMDNSEEDSEEEGSEEDSSDNEENEETDNSLQKEKDKSEHKSVDNASAVTINSNSHKHHTNKTHSSASSQKAHNSVHRRSHNSKNNKSSFISLEHQQHQQQQEQRQAERKRVARRLQSITKRYSRDLFLYYYASALLKSTLYMTERSAYALQHVSATDTVRIEDLLSAMMDFTLASVKLRHVCFTLHERLRKAQALPDISLYSRQDNVVLPSLWALKMQTQQQQHNSGNEMNDEESGRTRTSNSSDNNEPSGHAKMTSEELPDHNSEKGLLSDLYTNPPSSTYDGNSSRTTQMNSTTSAQHTWLQESENNRNMKTEQSKGKRNIADIDSEDDDNHEDEVDVFGNSLDSLDDDYYYKYRYNDSDANNYNKFSSNNANIDELDVNWTNTRPMQPAEYYIALIRKQHDFMMRWITLEIASEAEDWFVKIRRSHGSVLVHFDYLEEQEEELEEHYDDEGWSKKNNYEKENNNNNNDDDDSSTTSSSSSSGNSNDGNTTKPTNKKHIHVPNTSLEFKRDKQLDNNTQQPIASELLWNGLLGNTEDSFVMKPTPFALTKNSNTAHSKMLLLHPPPSQQQQSQQSWQYEDDMLKAINSHTDNIFDSSADNNKTRYRSKRQQRIAAIREREERTRELLKAYHVSIPIQLTSHPTLSGTVPMTFASTSVDASTFTEHNSSINVNNNKHFSHFPPLYLTCEVGNTRMRKVFECSSVQMYMHSRSLLVQLMEKAENESSVLSQSNMLSTFMLQLWANVLQSCETTLTAYWSGIASAIHAGLYDYYPSPKSVMDHILHGPALTPILGKTSENVHEMRNTHDAAWESSVPSSLSEKQRQQQEQEEWELEGNHIKDVDRNNRLQNQATAAGVLLTNSVHTVPLLRFIPILYDQGSNSSLLMNDAAYKANSNGQTLKLNSTSPIRGIQSLRSRSIDTVEQIITQTTSLLRTLLLPFIHTSVCYGFVESMSAYSIHDVRSEYSSETVELHAALLVEVIIGQWESMMSMVQTCSLHIKVAIGESATSSTLQSEVQVSEIKRLLLKLEEMQHECVQLYLYGLELLAKAYVHVLPSLQIPISFAGLDHRIRARLSRDYVSTNLPNKLLNLFSVVLDRTLPLLRRENEIFDAADLFAAKAEEISEIQTGISKEETHNNKHAKEKSTVINSTRHDNIHRWRRGSVGSNRSDSASSHPVHTHTHRNTNTSHDNKNKNKNINNKNSTLQESERVVVDLVTQSMAVYNASLVQHSIQHHTVHVEQVMGNLLMTFVDIIHGKGQRVSDALALHVSSEMKETVLVESIADALTLPTTVIPILEDHLLAPCLFANLVELTQLESESQPVNKHSDNKNNNNEKQQEETESNELLLKSSVKSIIAEQIAKFHTRFVVPVEEHTQLVIDALLNMYLTLPQEQITLAVRSFGFMNSLFDWQRFTLPSSIAASSESHTPFHSHVPASQSPFEHHPEQQQQHQNKEKQLLLYEEEEQTEESQGVVTGEMGYGVRLYIADCLTIIARAQEVLNGIHQPSLGAAVTQKLMAHFANSFIAGMTFSINGFEFSHECSNEFKLHGSLLLEVEGLTILSLIEHLLQSHLTQHTTDRTNANNNTTPTANNNLAHVTNANNEKLGNGLNSFENNTYTGTKANTTKNSTTTSAGNTNENYEVLPELLLARTRLQEVVQSLITASDELTWNLCHTTVNASLNTSSAPSASNTELSHTNYTKHNNVNTVNRSLCSTQRILTISERERVRTRMVHLAIQHTQYMIEAISSYLEESSLLSSTRVSALAMNESSTQRIAERLAKRLGKHSNEELETENKEETTRTSDAKAIPHMARRATKKLKTILRKRAERNDHDYLSAKVNTGVEGDNTKMNTDEKANTTIPTSLTPASNNVTVDNKNNKKNVDANDHINKNSSTIEKVQRNATLFRNAVAAQAPTLQSTDNNIQNQEFEQQEKNRMVEQDSENKVEGLAENVNNTDSTAVNNTKAWNATNVATAASAIKDSSPSADTQQPARRVRRVVFEDEHLTRNVKDSNSTNISQRDTIRRTNRFRRKNVV